MCCILGIQDAVTNSKLVMFQERCRPAGDSGESVENILSNNHNEITQETIRLSMRADVTNSISIMLHQRCRNTVQIYHFVRLGCRNDLNFTCLVISAVGENSISFTFFSYAAVTN